MGENEELLEDAGAEENPTQSFLLGYVQALKERIEGVEEMERINSAVIFLLFELITKERSKLLDDLLEKHPHLAELFAKNNIRPSKK